MRSFCLTLLLLCVVQSVWADISRIAFGSCADQREPQPIWASIARLNADLVVLLGDNVYADTDDMAEMRAAYAALASVPSFRSLRQITSIEAIWDDHDYGLNDAGADYPKRAESQQVFLDFFGEPGDSDRRRTPGIYAVREYGPAERRIQLILLDTRYFRSPFTHSLNPLKRYRPDDNPELTMLGEEQWRWLAEQLNRDARVRIIASGIQIINDEHAYETWGNLPRERQRLFDLIRELRVGGVVLVSGDRHFAEIAELDDAVGYPLLELTASGLTHAWEAGPDSPHTHRLAAYGGLNFGSIEVDWEQESPSISLVIHDVDGNEVARASRRLNELQP